MYLAPLPLLPLLQNHVVLYSQNVYLLRPGLLRLILHEQGLQVCLFHDLDLCTVLRSSPKYERNYKKLFFSDGFYTVFGVPNKSPVRILLSALGRFRLSADGADCGLSRFSLAP